MMKRYLIKTFLIKCRIEILRAVVVKGSIFWGTTPCSPSKVEPTFRRNMSPSSSRSNSKQIKKLFYDIFLLNLLFNYEDQGNKILRNVGRLSTECTALYPVM
jgi:hypothetical protein